MCISLSKIVHVSSWDGEKQRSDLDLGRRKCERRVWRMARSGGQRTNLRRRRRRYTTRSWLIPSSHVRVNASGGVLVLTQRITARAIQKFTHCALNTISKFPPGWPCLFPSSPKNRSFFPRFSPRFLKVSRKCRLCLREPALYIYIYRDNNRCVQAKNFTENK